MSGCLAISSFDGKPSKLHNQLISIFGDDEAGIAAASAEYEYLKSDSFKEDVGFDWETLETIDEVKGREQLTLDEAIKLGYVNEQKEPLVINQNGRPLTKVKNNLAGYRRTDGSIKWFETNPLSQFTESEVKELSGFAIFNAMNGFNGLKNLDFEQDLKIDIKGIFEEGSDFYEYLKEELGMNKADIEALKQRSYEQLRSIKLKILDNDDIKREEDDNPDTQGQMQTKEDNSVVKVESFTLNSKNTATANVKMLLSFVPEFESFTRNEDGTITFKRKPGELVSTKFKDVDKLWRKIEENISGIFTKNVNGEVESVLSQMMNVLYEVGQNDPTIMYVYGMLNSDTYDTYKKIQFAQAFLKQRLLYYTSEVDGKPGNTKYKFFDAGKATSKEAKFISFWETGFSASPYFKQTITDKTVSYSLDKDKINSDIRQVNSILQNLRELTRAKETSLTQKQRDSVIEMIKRLGVPLKDINDVLLDNVLRRVDKEAGQSTYNEVRATGILINSYIKPALVVLGTKVENKDINKKGGDFTSPIKSNSFTKLFAEETSKLNDDFSENTIMSANNKMMWGFSLPTYVDIVAHAFKNGFIQNENGQWYNPYIDELRAQTYNKNSKWLEWLSVKDNADKFFAITFSSLQSTKDGSVAVDNKDIQFFDQVNDQLNKYLNGIKDSEKSIFYSPTPADKGRMLAFIGPDIAKSQFNVSTETGNVVMSKDSQSVVQVSKYFEDEYTRIQSVWNTVTSTEDTSGMYIHYHINAKTGQTVNEQGVPVGNGFKSQLLPELSWDYKNTDPDNPTKVELMAEKIRQELYDSSKKYKPKGLTSETNEKIRYLIATVASQRMQELHKEFIEKGFLEQKDGKISNVSIDSQIWSIYAKDAVNTDNRNKQKEVSFKIIGDYLMNGIISNIEYNKVFSGDIAYYKDSIDYNKRIPATYTDGKYLVDIDNVKDLDFTAAVVKPIILEAKKLYKDKKNPKDDSMEENFVYSLTERAKFMDEKIRPTKEEIEAQALSLVKQYEGVNAADAQGWISLERWKFLKAKSDGWSPKLEEAYQQMKSGNMTYETMKLAAQPLKGVYFNRDAKTGVPTYLKYSQMVLIPGMWKGTTLENLSELMNKEKDGIDEVITLDGVKSGALSPTEIHNPDGSFKSKEDIKFNTYKLSNLHWKLQQQLPVKTIKDNMDLGSQIMKNVLSNIIPTEVYGKLDGRDLTGKEVVEMVHSTISELTDIAFDETTKMLGTDSDGKITSKGKLYRELAKQLESKNMPSFVVEAIKRGYSLDAIPQVRYKAQNVISSMINNNIAKTITPGASMIQMSNVGVTNIDTENTDPKNGGIFMLKNVKDLNRPEINIRRNKETGEVEKATVYSGQVFLPHSIIAKYIPNYRELTQKELLERIDKRLFNIIGYRIPNQKMSSIQPLEIVGILPPSMGDAIMMYSEITTQTGSDFDIDKTYIMMPEYIGDAKEGTLKYINSKPNKEGKQSKKQLRNQLFELYNILLKSPLNYADMASGIDGSYLQDLIKTTHKKKEAAKKMTALKLSDPYYQMQIKFANSAGKSGVGLTANQMVDHIFTQIHDTVYVEGNIGIGNIRGINQDFSGIYDTQGKTITDTISMFLNAFVDIAKDPYITDGNFNEVTSNIVFFMIRAGVPLDFIVKFMGQPSFERVTEKIINSKSLVTGKRSKTIETAIEEVLTEIQEDIKSISSSINNEMFTEISEEADRRFSDISKIKLKDLQENIDNEQQEDLLYLKSQQHLLNHLSMISEMSIPLTELVLASKADVNGGGPDIATHITNLSKYNKVINDNKFTGLEERFAPNSMLGSKTQRTLEYLNKLDEQLFITANPGYKSIYTYLSLTRKSSEYITDKDFVQNVERHVYSSVLNDVFNLTDDFYIQDEDYQNFFITTENNKSIADRVIRLQQQEDLQDNELIQNLEIKSQRGYKFLSLDNFKNKPSSSLDNIQRGWEQLLKTPQYNQFAKDLVKYSYMTSGFSRNRNSIYEVLPLSVSDQIERKLKQHTDQNSIESFVPIEMINNLYRSAHSSDISPILRKGFNQLSPLIGISGIKKITPGNTTIIDKMSELKLPAGSVIFVQKRSPETLPQNVLREYNLLDQNEILIREVSGIDPGDPVVRRMYKNEGEVLIGDKTYKVLSETHKLGINDNGLKIYESGQGKDRSAIPENNPKKYDEIKTFVEWLKKKAILHESFVPKNTRVVHEKNNMIKPSFEAMENLTRRGIMEEKC